MTSIKFLKTDVVHVVIPLMFGTAHDFVLCCGVYLTGGYTIVS